MIMTWKGCVLANQRTSKIILFDVWNKGKSPWVDTRWNSFKRSQLKFINWVNILLKDTKGTWMINNENGLILIFAWTFLGFARNLSTVIITWDVGGQLVTCSLEFLKSGFFLKNWPEFNFKTMQCSFSYINRFFFAFFPDLIFMN